MARRPSVAVLALALAAACAAPVRAATPAIDADLMTVSGRFALPAADGSSFRGHLWPASMLSGALPSSLGWTAEAFHAAFHQAAGKSLANFGYRAESSGDAAPVVLEVTALEVDKADGVTVAHAHIHMRLASGADTCLDHESVGEFKALWPVRTGDGQRAFGLVASVALAVATRGAPTPNIFLSDQFQNATAQNTALNARRETGKDEGVAPDRGGQGAARFAVANAVQLALAEMIEHLGRAPSCRPSAP